MTQSPVPTPPQTRQKSATTAPAKKTRKELEDAEGTLTDVRNKEQALTFLQAKEYLVPGEPTNLLNLSHVLLQFAHAAAKMPKTLTDGLRAVAFLMADTGIQQIADEITSAVKEQLTEQIEQYNAQVETMRDAVEHVTKAADKTTAAQELMDRTPETENTGNPQRPANPPNTYASITQQHIPTAHLTVITRGEANDKQMLLQKDPTITDGSLDRLTEKELVVKANTTIDLMGMEAEDRPDDTKFVGAKRMRNSNILYQLNKREAANWLKRPDVQKAFTTHYGGMSNIRNRLFYTLVEFVPTTFEAGADYAHARVEDDSGIASNAITYSKYIKPARLRSETQRTAHIIIGFNNRQAANHTIEHGLFIEGKRVTARKLLPELKRCLKCQGFGHFATDCKASTDICARCKGPHRTSTCTITDTTTFTCANCPKGEGKGHGSADRRCSTFIKETDKLHSRIPETKYRFFPTNEPHTWRLTSQHNSHIEDQVNAWQQGANWAHGQENTYRDYPDRRQGRSARENEQFMDNWQHIRRRGRQNPNANQQPNIAAGMDTRTTNDGWPTKPVQTTLQGFFSQSQREREWRERQNGTQQRDTGRHTPWGDTGRRTPWGDQDPNEQDLGPVPPAPESGSPQLSYVDPSNGN